MSRNIIVVLDNVRSALNVGSILRSAVAFNVGEVVAGGITPHTALKNDPRLPHVIKNTSNKIAKTALGAEKHIKMTREQNVIDALQIYRKRGYLLCSVEQDQNSESLKTAKLDSNSIVLIFGSEIDGVSREILDISDHILEVPMNPAKESINVSVTAGIALFQLS